jgi:hypothetical protein
MSVVGYSGYSERVCCAILLSVLLVIGLFDDIAWADGVIFGGIFSTKHGK